MADGTAWTKETMASPTLSTIKFDGPGGARSANGGVGRSTTMDLTMDSSATGINVIDMDVESGELHEKEKEEK